MMLIAEPGSSEEIVVTARRREESAQTVPISLNAFSATRLTEASIQTLSDLTALSPGLRFSAEGGAGKTNVSLRGLSKLPIGEGIPAVVVISLKRPCRAMAVTCRPLIWATFMSLMDPTVIPSGITRLEGPALPHTY